MLLDIFGTPWSMQDGRVEVEPNPAPPARKLPVVNTADSGGVWNRQRRNPDTR